MNKAESPNVDGVITGQNIWLEIWLDSAIVKLDDCKYSISMICSYDILTRKAYEWHWNMQRERDIAMC